MTLDDSEKVAIIALSLLSISFIVIAGASPSDSNIAPKSTLDGQQLSNTTTQAVQNAGSYTSQTATTIDINTSVESRTQRITTLRVDLESDRGIRITNETLISQGTTQTGSRTVYTDGNTSYRRTNIRGNSTYATQTGQQNRSRISPVNTTRFDAGYAPVVNAVSWAPNETETVSGTNTLRYTATNVSNPEALTGQSTTELSNVSASLWLDQNDVVRKFEVKYTLAANGNTRTTQASLSITNIGSTTVSQPRWLSEAESATSTEQTASPTNQPLG
jgi:hypothetical protein